MKKFRISMVIFWLIMLVAFVFSMGNANAQLTVMKDSSTNITLGTIKLDDGSVIIVDTADPTKAVIIEAGSITTGTTITLTVPDSSGTIALDSDMSGFVDTSGTPVANDIARFMDGNTIEGLSYSELLTALSLNNVENTAISTWAGSANITTLGTISTGAMPGTLTTLSTTNFDGNLSATDTTVQAAMETLDELLLDGDVSGPAISVDNTIPRFDSTSGKLIQGSGIVIDDSDIVYNAMLNSSTTKFYDLGSGNTLAFELGSLSGNRILNAPDVSGTIALTATTANTSLSNLGALSINTDLEVSNDGLTIGNSTLGWKFLYLAKYNTTSPTSNGQIAYNDTTDKFEFFENGAVVNLGSATGSDELLKISANDTTAGYLNGKLVAGTNCTLAEGNDGANETLTINVSAGAPTDSDAIHDNVAAEISVLTEKVTPVSADLILIEDSADSNNKKKAQIGNLKSAMSLNNVENTAISTWAGSANITTLGTVTSGTLSTGAVIGGVTMELGTDGRGDIYYRNVSGVLTRLAAGTEDYVLTMASGVPAWEAAAVGFSDPMTTRGDIIIRNAANATARLGIGTTGQVLISDGTDIAWGSAESGANTALSNLGTVAINTSLLSDTDNTDALGSSTVGWTSLYLSDGGTAPVTNGEMTYNTANSRFEFYENGAVSFLSASPLTTKGDVYTYSTANARLAVGTNDYVLTADSAEATGLKWAAVTGGGSTNFYINADAMKSQSTNGATKGLTELSTNSVMIAYADFDAATDEFLQYDLIMPSNYANGTITCTFEWTTATTAGTGDAVWGCQAMAVSNDDPYDATWGTAVTVTDSFLLAGDRHYTRATTAITIGGTPATGDSIHLRFYRDADNGSDTYTEDARLVRVLISF